jgi:hypothetical protein
LNYRIFQRNQRRITVKSTIDKSELSIPKLAPLHEIDELLKFSQQVFTGHQHYVAQRIMLRNAFKNCSIYALKMRT